MILITGGAGFIGSNVVAALNDRGRTDLVVNDRLRDGEKWRNLAKREIADFVYPEELDAFLEKDGRSLSAVVHMGAVSSTTETDADLILRNNFRLSLNLWKWCARHGVRFIYASSAATYGDGAAGFSDDATRDALAKLKPLNAYGWSKHLFDRLALSMAAHRESRPPQWAGLKFFNVYGPNESHKGPMRSVVHQIFPDASRGKPVCLFRSHRPDYADGGQLRDFVWVGDVVDVILWLLDNEGVSGLFNLGTGQARSFADLAIATFRAARQEPKIDYIDMPSELRARYQYFTQADMTALRAAGYRRKFTPLEDGIGRYVREFLATDDPYR